MFHDDQQGTGVVALAALKNALKLAGKDNDAKVIVLGSGSAGIGISKMLIHAGFRNMLVLDSNGIIYKGRKDDMNEFKDEIALMTNPERVRGTFEDAIKGADVFIGASGIPHLLKKWHIQKMADKPIVFALTNPIPEIEYADALKYGAYIAATGRSDTPNQINNVVAFPGVMRGLLEVRAKSVSLGMLNAAAEVIAKGCRHLDNRNIMPSVVDKRTELRLTEDIAVAVASEAIREGLARIKKGPDDVRKSVRLSVKRYEVLEKRFAE